MRLPRRATVVLTLALTLVNFAVAPPAARAAGQDVAASPTAATSDLVVPGWDVEAFAHPTAQKPAVLWFWNRVQTEAQVDRTLQDMHDAGFTETVIFRMDAEPFFTPAWFDRVEHVLEKSRDLGMKVWLDNDSQFPSGAAGGLIVNGGTVGGKTYAPRPDLGVKTAVRTGDVVVHGGARVDLAGLFGAGVHLEDGEVVADAAVFPGITLLKEGAGWSDYTVEAGFTVESGTAGFMVRSPDKRNGYLVDVRKAGYVDFWKQVDGGFSQIRLGSAAPAGWNPDGRHTISIRAVGDQISATLDGMAVPPVTDRTFATGRVGMRVDGPQKWRLDDLEVAPVPAGTPLYRDDFTDPASLDDFDVAVTPLKNVIAVTARPAGSSRLDDVVDLTGDRTWDAPAGDWRVEAFTYRFRGDNYADTLDAEAMALYDQIVMGEYHDRFAWAFGTVLQGFADDEPSLSDRPNENAVPWSPSLAGRVEAGGTTVARAMVSVFNDMGREGATAKGRFYRAASDQWVDTYWKPKYEWTEAHGVSIISNPLWDEHGPLEELRHSGNLLTAHQWAQIPGTDLIFNDVGNGAARFLPRTAASVAHQMGRPLVYDELMGATGWEKSLDDLREGAATSALRGINKALFHTTYDGIEGIPYPPVFMRENTWWPWMGQVNTWTGRLMEFGRHTTAAPTALLQTQRSNEAAQRSAAGFEPDRDWIATMGSLEDSQVDFDQLDEGALTADPQVLTPASVAGGTLRVGRMTYTTVVVPKAPYLSLGAARTLRDFVASGGEVVFAGPAPAMEVDGKDSQLAALVAEIRRLGGDRVVTVAAPAQAGPAAAGLGQAAVTLSTPDTGIRVLRFTEGGTDGYLLLNEGGAPVTVDVTFPSDGVPAVWDPETGDVTEATTYRATGEGTVVPMRLEPRAPVGVTVSGTPGAHVSKVVGAGRVTSATVAGGVLTGRVRTERSGVVRLRGDDGAGGALAGAGAPVVVPPALDLDGVWTMALENGAAPITRPLRGWNDVAPLYSGSATYTTRVTLGGNRAEWTLDLGRVADVAQVTVNGTHVADRVWAPYTVDLGGLLREGVNTIEVRVTNTQGNEKNRQPYDSGLFGPVTLVPSVTVPVTLTPAAVSAGRATATVTRDGADVGLTVVNHGAEPVTGVVTAAGPDGWTAQRSAPVRVPAGGSARGVAHLFPGGFEPVGDVPVRAAFLVGGTAVDDAATTLRWSFATPPGGAADHVDLGDTASEKAHGLTASPTSGTNVEAGLSRRYAGYRVPDAWYEFDVAVTPGKPFVLQGLETYDDNPQQKSYRILVGGELVATRLNVRPLRRAGTAAYRLHVPAGFATTGTVRVRVQSRADPDFSDPSLADVWALPAPPPHHG
ncbi:glycosyl hydrolase [Actinoplanes sp. NBRC 103695]|uniref:glycosyl hydrolase n=1 Tax=Actinoplanes sp. NBRC 103695 TaxID=3032202 RepID=UPI0024A387A5|nr:glycosyl hydrolase [Actinoplanes sp. NBRC 103695]GLY93219.1 glycoside hydrolase [Actinoplanes sp. NBRC 103695]